MAVPARSESYKSRSPSPIPGRYTGKGRTQLIGIVMTQGKLVIAGADLR
jgi:hypothetical protein